MKEQKILRKLGYWETFNALVHDELYGHGNLVVLATIDGIVSENEAVDVLEALFNRHPVLQCTLLKKRDIYYLNHTAVFDNIPIAFIKNKDCKGVFEKELITPLAVNNYLWRINIVINEATNQTKLISTFSHAIGDGLSVINFVKEFIESLNLKAIGKDISLPKLNLLPSVESLLIEEKFSRESQRILEQTEQSLGDEIPHTEWPFFKMGTDIEKRKTGTIFQNLEETFVTKLKNTCKENKITVNDALNAALLGVVLSLNDESTSIVLCTPINLRNFTEPQISSENFGCNVTMVTTEHNITKENYDFLEVAVDYHKKLRKSISLAGKYPKNFQLKDIKPYIDQCKMERDKFFMEVGITNIGQFDFEMDRQFVINDFYICASRQAADFALLLCVVTINNKMCITYSFTEPEMDKKKVATLAEKFIEKLIDFMA